MIFSDSYTSGVGELLLRGGARETAALCMRIGSGGVARRELGRRVLGIKGARSTSAKMGTMSVEGRSESGQAGTAAAAAAATTNKEGEVTAAADPYAFFERIGRPKYHVAPMVDQSELAFRLLCRRHGATAAYTPMLHARLFLENEHYRNEHLTLCGAGEDRPLLVQFCANDPKILLGAARLVQDNCDAVDINLGCPQRIAKKGRYGAFLMDDLGTVEAMVRELHANLNVPVTCKIRLFPELKDTLAYAKMLERAGCTMLAVHGRTREMKDCKRFRADWDAIKAVKEALSIPVLANGDIRNLDDIERCLEHTGCDGVLSADPLLVNPALFDAQIWQETKRVGDESGLDANSMVPGRACELLREYLELCRTHPAPFRMVKAHAHKLLGSWFREFTDLRDNLNQIVIVAKKDLGGKEYNLALDSVDAIASSAHDRIKDIVASGRSAPVPAPRDKDADAKAVARAREEAIRLQNEEEDALAHLDESAKRQRV